MVNELNFIDSAFYHKSMKLYLKHIGLLIGIALIFFSFLFFGRQQGTYDILITSGLVISFLFFVSILVAKETVKIKVVWVAIVIFLAIIEQLTEPFLIDHSYCTFISEHKNVLNEINTMLIFKKGEIDVSRDSVFSKEEQLNADEKAKLKAGLGKAGVYRIYKFDSGIYYGLWAFLKVRLGVTYLPGTSDSDNKYRHLTGHWFR
jgi:hypothetical protein